MRLPRNRIIITSHAVDRWKERVSPVGDAKKQILRAIREAVVIDDWYYEGAGRCRVAPDGSMRARSKKAILVFRQREDGWLDLVTVTEQPGHKRCK